MRIPGNANVDPKLVDEDEISYLMGPHSTPQDLVNYMNRQFAQIERAPNRYLELRDYAIYDGVVEEVQDGPGYFQDDDKALDNLKEAVDDTEKEEVEQNEVDVKRMYEEDPNLMYYDPETGFEIRENL